MNVFRSLTGMFLLACVFVVQVVPGVGIHVAHAVVQSNVCQGRSPTTYPQDACTPEQAFNAARAYAQALIDQEGRCQPGAYPSVEGFSSNYGTAASGSLVGVPRNSSGCSYLGGWRTHYYNRACPAGSSWNATTRTCFSAAACLSKPNLKGHTVFGDHIVDSIAYEGCEFEPAGDSVGLCLMDGVEPSCISPTEWKPTGQPVAEGMDAPEAMENDQGCIPAGEQTFCLKSDGRHCASASTGRQICWRPGETGEKTDGKVLQVRNAGPTPVTPQTPPPPGDTFAASGDPMHVNTTAGEVSINTVTQNYTTVNGTNAGGSKPDQGEPGDGSGSSSDADGDGKEDGSVVGGIDCQHQPVVTGDPILANVVLQTWGTRCALESQNAVRSSGNIQDCHDNFVVTGPEGDATVAKLQGIRAQICGHYGDENEDGQPDWTEGEAPTLPGEGEGGGGEGGGNDEPGPPASLTVGSGLLDMGGMLGGSTTCPALGVIEFGPFGDFDLNSEPMWCDLVSVMRAVVLLMAAFAAIRILMGGK